jgi:hypothetical protein
MWPMSEVINYYCDVCGAQRKEANHWFSALIDLPFANQDLCSGLTFVQFVPQLKIHLCGQACARRLLDCYLTRLANGGPIGEANLIAAFPKTQPVRVASQVENDRSEERVHK